MGKVKYEKGKEVVTTFKWNGIDKKGLVKFLTNGRGKSTDTSGDLFYFDMSVIRGGLVFRADGMDVPVPVGTRIHLAEKTVYCCVIGKDAVEKVGLEPVNSELKFAINEE